jgi:hypothetical protein
MTGASMTQEPDHSIHTGGPWITATHCTVVTASAADNRLLTVRCPGLACMTMVDLIDGRMAVHNHPVTFQPCVWSGVGVHDDREPQPTPFTPATDPSTS